MGSQKVGHDWATFTLGFWIMCLWKKEFCTLCQRDAAIFPVLLRLAWFSLLIFLSPAQAPSFSQGKGPWGLCRPRFPSTGPPSHPISDSILRRHSIHSCGCQWAPRHVEPLPPAQHACLAGCATLLPVVCTWGLLQKAPWDYRNSSLWCLGVYITLGLAHHQGVTRAEGKKPSSVLPNETNPEAVLMLQSAPWGEPGAGASLKAPSGLSLLLLWLVSLPITGFCWEQLHGKFLSMDPCLESPPQNSLVECPPFHSGSYHLSSWSTMEVPGSPSQLLTHPAHRLFHIILRMSHNTALWSKGSDHCSSAVGSKTNSARSSEPSTPRLQSINH